MPFLYCKHVIGDHGYIVGWGRQWVQASRAENIALGATFNKEITGMARPAKPKCQLVGIKDDLYYRVI